ncbi:hypothetical protein V1283_005277 [Bradyrhizobium sp. AZCC 2262]|uniref:hypothetical protein n=1 Tax=Bradyrhizobium sp. AZCC 2262 TaxID=3117022 RepID=UPI002FEEF32D
MLLHSADLSQGLLQTDIGLIALNETHAVFSIRVARATLAENHFFLNVVSDIAGGDGRLQMPAPTPAPKSNRLRAAAAWWGSWIRPKKPAS